MTSDTADDLALIRQLIAGDRAAWCRFVDRYSGLVYARVAQTARELQIDLDSGDHEDLCAEVFAALLQDNCRSLRNFRGASRLSTWLVAVTRRLCIRRLLQRDRQLRELETLHRRSGACPEPATSDSSNALQQIIRHEEHSQLQTALDQLKPTDRQVLQIFYCENLKYAEIGQRLGISVNTVGPKLQRAQRRLRRILHNAAPGRAESRFR